MPNFLVTATVATSPKPLSAVPLISRRATILACKGLNGPTSSPNTGLIKIGNSPTASQQPFDMNPGDERVDNAPAGGRLDLARIYLTVATDGDGVIVDYE